MEIKKISEVLNMVTEISTPRGQSIGVLMSMYWRQDFDLAKGGINEKNIYK